MDLLQVLKKNKHDSVFLFFFFFLSCCLWNSSDKYKSRRNKLNVPAKHVRSFFSVLYYQVIESLEIKNDKSGHFTMHTFLSPQGPNPNHFIYHFDRGGNPIIQYLAFHSKWNPFHIASVSFHGAYAYKGSCRNISIQNRKRPSRTKCTLKNPVKRSSYPPGLQKLNCICR